MLTFTVAAALEEVCYHSDSGRGSQTPAMALLPMAQEPEDQKFRRGVDQFNRRAFFEAHETWEDIWLAAPEPDKTFLQGIIQLAAAFHHYTSGNRTGAESLLRAGLNRLEPCPGEYRGVNMEALRTAGRRWLTTLAAGNDLTSEALPGIERANQD